MIAGLRDCLAAQEKQARALQETVHALHRSRSWRITRPLRALGSLRKRLGSLLAIVRRLSRSQSLPSLARKAVRVWRREGLQGLRARIRQQKYLAAQPGPAAGPGFALAPAAIVRDRQGRYALDPVPSHYTYVEPQPPMDLAQRLEAMQSKPLFSIVVPVYNTPPELLEAVLDSVKKQWYPHWQLILSDDASPSEETRQALARIDHPQIKLLRLERNQGIAGATNAALDAAEGDFIVFMDHDDEITVDCLYELALCIEREQPDFIYSDEDKLTQAGDYSEPHFKPDWSPDTMMSTMFTCHVSCVRRSLLEKTGGCARITTAARTGISCSVSRSTPTASTTSPRCSTTGASFPPRSPRTSPPSRTCWRPRAACARMRCSGAACAGTWSRWSRCRAISAWPTICRATR
ncbi:glycosyltransferase [Comamonas endophytica]|uniref:glycosyltransferase n=1 Tax=Comamonas endophytica TaxID=2949090 RepID=UPI0036123C3D